MAEISESPPPTPGPKRRKLAWLLGLAGGIAAAAGAFHATRSGLISVDGKPAGPVLAALPDIAFVPLDPVVVSLGATSGGRHLRFTAQIEVHAHHRAEVEMLRPRILDLLNGYLRAVDPAGLEAQGALLRLRAQMLRRIQIITGEGRVRDLLVTEFVIN